MKPLTEEYYDLYIKNRAQYMHDNFYENPKNREIIIKLEIEKKQSLFIAVVRKKDNEYIGYLGIKDTSAKSWEFCIELLKEYCNQGYGFDAIKLFLKKISEITGENKQQFTALVEVDNIPSQKLMLKLGGELIGLNDFIFYYEERSKKFEEDHLNEITEDMIKIAKELSVEPRKLLSHVLEYRIYADKL